MKCGHLSVTSRNIQWIWLALDADTREIMGVFIGDRSRQSAKQLWQSLPAVYRQCAICYTDFWEAYEQVLPSKRHRAVWRIWATPVILNGLTTHCGSSLDG